MSSFGASTEAAQEIIYMGGHNVPPSCRIGLRECALPYLKDLIYIYLEPEAQGCGRTFKSFYLGSKYPYFISHRGKWVYLFCRGCISVYSDTTYEDEENFQSKF